MPEDRKQGEPQGTLAKGSIPLRERRSFAEEWEHYAEQVIPKTAPPMQLREMKRSFYAGAATMLSLTSGGFDADSEPTELDVAWLESIHQELVQFAADLGEGRA
jgi:hypothetical protein